MKLDTQNITMKGKLTIKKFNSRRELVQEITIPNLVVAAGKEHIARMMVGTLSEDPMSHMEIGASNVSATLSDTTLRAPLEGARVEFDTVTVTGSTITYAATFGPGVAGQLYEAGIFNNSSGGVMLCRTTFPPVNKTSSDTIAITWNVAVG